MPQIFFSDNSSQTLILGLGFGIPLAAAIAIFSALVILYFSRHRGKRKDPETAETETIGTVVDPADR